MFAFVFVLSQGSEREKNKLVVKYNISFSVFVKEKVQNHTFETKIPSI